MRRRQMWVAAALGFGACAGVPSNGSSAGGEPAREASLAPPSESALVEAPPVQPPQTPVVEESPPPAAAPPPRDPDAPLPCPPPERWPEGMACVGGGTFILGDEDGQPDEQPPGEVYVDTFYMDLYETTNEQFEECIRSGRCQRPMPFRHFRGPRQPMVAVSWYDAVHSCEMRGERLPTEAEWERAASGPDHTRYPWGDEPLGCERAAVKDARGEGCGREVTFDVGSFPPGHWGLYDMAGNVHEWVQDRYSECLRGCSNECGDACFGRNPRGPCGGGLARCRHHGMRSVRGGSWFWPLERARTSARRGSGPANRGPHRFGFRCARDLVVPDATGGSAAPGERAPAPAAPGERAPAPAPPGAPTGAAPRAPAPGAGASTPASPVGPLGSAEQPLTPAAREILDAVPDEHTPPPGQHYFRSNEWRQDLLAPHLAGRGGALVGVGADQNYTMAAMAGSSIVVLVDFDPEMPWIHATYDVLVRASETPEALIDRFAEESEASTVAMLSEALAGRPRAARIVRHYRLHRADWHAYLGRVRRLVRDGRPFSWLADPQMYRYVRQLFLNGRVISRNGDVTAERTLRSVGEACRRLGVVVRVVYFSNAEQFFPYSDTFIENMRQLPTDERSVVVRTIRHRRIGVAEDGRWHYMVHDFPDFLSRLETGAYRRSFAFTADLLAAGRPFLGEHGISTMTAQTPRAILQRAQERRRRRRAGR